MKLFILFVFIVIPLLSEAKLIQSTYTLRPGENISVLIKRMCQDLKPYGAECTKSHITTKKAVYFFSYDQNKPGVVTLNGLISNQTQLHQD